MGFKPTTILALLFYSLYIKEINIVKLLATYLSLKSKADIDMWGRVVGSNPIWGSDFFCVLLWLILYVSLYFHS